MNVTPIPLGHFELIEPVGHGGMGEVWRGIHVAQQVPVAIKVIGGQLARSPHFQQAFRTEVQAVARLSHPNIIMVFDYGLIPPQAEDASHGRLVAGSPFFAMELAGLGSLDDVPEISSWEELKGLLLELLDALAHAHARGVIHRDIKPGNILLCSDDDNRPGLKLTDFGLAAAGERLKAERLTGTPAFMAPEQCDGNWRDHGPWTDLYGLGCVAYALASGHPPFDDTNPMQIVVQQLSVSAPRLHPLFELPDGFEAWVQKLMAKAPRERFRRAADAAEALKKLRLSRPAPTLSQAPPLVPLDWRERRPLTHTSMRLVGVGLGLYDLRPVPMVHRERERDQIWQALNDVALNRRARAVLLRGEAGVGKTRLVEWACQRAHEVGAAITMSAAHSPTVASPNEGLVRMLTSHLRCIGLERIEVLLRVKTILQDQGVREDYEWNALTELLSPALPDDSGSMRVIRFSNPQERYTVVRRYLERLARERPIILALEDVQWGFHTLGFVEHLLEAQQRHPSPILVLMTARDDGLDAQPAEASRLQEILGAPRTETLVVPPLDADERASLVRELLGLEGPLATQVEERTQGNPLFAVQLVGDWVQRGVLEVGDTGFVLKSGERAVIPDDIHELWVARTGEVIKDFPREDAQVSLEIASALGRDVNALEWREAITLAGRSAPASLVDVMIASGLALPSEDGWSFAHGMLRESLERAASEADRWREHNRTCAQMIEARAHQQQQGIAERIGRHYLAAEELELAVDYLLEGAKEREETSDFSVVHLLLNRRDEALASLGVSEADPRWGAGWLIRSQAFRLQSKMPEALDAAERAVEQARAHGWDGILPEALRRMGHAAQNLNQSERAEALLREALELYQDRAQDRLGEATALRSLGTLTYLRGHFDEAETLLSRALELSEEVGHERLVGDCLYGLADVARKRGELAQTEALIQRASEVYEDCGNQLGVSICLGALADVHRYLGKLEEAETGYRRAVDLNEAIGGGMGVIYQLNLGLLLLRRARYEEAEALLLETYEALEQRSWRYLLGVVDIALLPGLAARDAWGAWEERLEQGVSLLEQATFYDPDIAWPAELAGDLAAERGQLERAQSAWRFALSQWDALGDAERARSVRDKMAREGADEG